MAHPSANRDLYKKMQDEDQTPPDEVLQARLERMEVQVRFTRSEYREMEAKYKEQIKSLNRQIGQLKKRLAVAEFDPVSVAVYTELAETKELLNERTGMLYLLSRKPEELDAVRKRLGY